MSVVLCMPLHRAKREDAVDFSVRCGTFSQRESEARLIAFGGDPISKGQAEVQCYNNSKFKQVWPRSQSNIQLPLLEDFAQDLQKHSNKADFRYARDAYLYMCYLGLEDQRLLKTLLVSIFIECGKTSDAQQILSRCPEESLYFWPSLIERYVDAGEVAQALIWFLQIEFDCTQLSKSALQALIKCCMKLKCPKQCQQVHANLVEAGLDTDVLLGTSLVEMYAKCGLVLEAREVLDEMQVRDVFAWNVLSLGYAECGLDGEALQCFEWLKREGLSPNSFTFVVALKVCGKAYFLEKGQKLHAEIMLKGFDSDNFVGSTLLDMYAKCGLLVEAEKVFEELQNKDVVSWTALILQYTEHGQATSALDYFERMQSEGVLPNAVTYMGALKACASLGALTKGQQIYANLVEEGFEEDVLTGGSLVDMYVKCGWLIEAHAVFEELLIKDMNSLIALLTGYSEHGLDDKILMIVETMQNDGVPLDPIVYILTLEACTNTQAFNRGLSIHCEIVKEEFDANPAVSSALMDMYAKGGLLAESLQVFDEVPLRDVVIWTTRMTCLLEHGLCKEALLCLEEMQAEGLSPNCVTYVCSLQACTRLQHMDVGQAVHARIVSGGFDKDPIIGNALVDFYAKCGSLEEIWEVFNRLAIKDVVSWNTLIAGFNEHDVGQEVLNSLTRMQAEGFSPTKITFLSYLRACSILGAKEDCIRTHTEIIKMGYEGDLHLGNTLVDMYIKLGSSIEAYEVFHKMPSRDVVSWNILIAGYAEHKLGEKGLKCLEQMIADGVLPNISTLVCGLTCCASVGALGAGQELHSKIIKEGHGIDAIVGSTLVDMYACCGLLIDAHEVFDNLLDRNVAWNAIISGYAAYGQDEKVLSCYEDMLAEGGSLDNVTFACVLKACGNVGAIIRGREVHILVTKEGSKDDALVCTMLIDMYASCGCLVDACDLFEGLTEKDVVSWSALIAGFARHGECEAISSLLENMEGSGVLLDEVTLLSVLTACSHSGLVDLGKAYFEVMEEMCSISPKEEHYNCMVDLLTRAGHLEMAMLVIAQMPWKASSLTWSTMLSACRNWGNSKLSHYIFEVALRSDKMQVAALYLMQYICADSYMWE